MTTTNKITKKELWEFDKWYTMEKIKHPDYRYGQAFLNYFNGIENLSLNSSEVIKDSTTFELFTERDYNKARELVLQYVKEDN